MISRRPYRFLALLVLAACQGERVSTPSDLQVPSNIAFAISDGANAGNPDFFFLPPMVTSQPSGLGTLNPDLSPTVNICAWNGANCIAGGYSQTFTNVPAGDDGYQQDWKIPKTPGIFRVSVEVEGVELGYADVKTTNGAEPGFVRRNPGSTLPIRFWINTHCTGDLCAEGFVDPQTGGEVVLEDEDGDRLAGVTVPPQPNGPPITITLQPCTEDIPGFKVFGTCITVNSSQEDPLTVPASVWICDAEQDPEVLDETRQDDIHLLRRHNGEVEVLPDAPDNCEPESIGSVGGLLRALVQGKWKQAGRQFVGLLSPRAAHAIDVGAGGHSDEFSDFQHGETEFDDGFEEESGWTATGFWHRSTLKDESNNPFVNSAVEDELVNLAPDDESGGALPAPFAGSYAFWYGEDAPGNYIGTRANSTPGSGGTSTSPNSGTLTSPVFTVPPAAVLRFNTWWEIESVNPSAFDLMSVSVVPVSPAGPAVLLGVLNPTSDPPGGSAPTPFSSSGFNLAPAWVEASHSLSAWAGQSVQLRFDFATVDELYNGFRGWVLDDVRVQMEPPVDLRVGPRAAALIRTGSGLNPAQPSRPRN